MPIVLKGRVELLPSNNGLTNVQLDDNNWFTILSGEDFEYYHKQMDIYFCVVLRIKISDFLLNRLANFWREKVRPM